MGLDKRCLGVVIAILLLSTSLAGCIDDNPRVADEPSGEVQLGGVDTVAVDREGERVWNIVMVVTAENFEGDEDVSWDQIHLDLIGPDGFVNGFELRPLVGPIPLELGAKLILKDPDSEFVHEGDMIIIHGVGKELEGGSVQLFMESTLLVEEDLPIQFSPEISVTFGEPVMGAIMYPGATSFTYDAEITYIDPANATLSWWTLQLCISSPNGDFTDLIGPMAEDPGVDGYDGEVSPLDVEFWYVEDPLNGTSGPGAPDGMDVGDGIKITGLSEKYVGADLALLKGDDPVWEGTIPEMPVVNLTFELTGPTISSQTRNETGFWNVSFMVDDVDPDDVIRWDSLWVKVLDSGENDSFSREFIGPDPGDYCSTILAFWNDAGGGANLVSVGDRIVIKGLNLSFASGWLEVYRGLTLLERIRLPSQWVVGDFELVMYNPSYIDSIGGPGYWDALCNISHVVPKNVEVPWEDLQGRVVDRNTDTELIPWGPLTERDSGNPQTPTILYYSIEVDYPTIPGYFLVVLLNDTFRGTWLEISYGGHLLCELELEGPYRPPSVYLNLAIPNVEFHSFANHTEYRVVLNVNKVTPGTYNVPWNSITIEVVSSTGSIVVPKTNPAADTGVYDEDPTDGIDVRLWYIEVTTGDHFVSAGDTFKLTGLTTDYEGATVKIYMNDEIIGITTLQTDFP